MKASEPIIRSDIRAITNCLSLRTNRLVPAGTVSAFASQTLPSGWLLCDGANVSRDIYNLLFITIGTTYGVGDNTTTFTLPNLKGKIPVGLDSTQSEFNTLGEIGGEKTHTLTVDEIPSHSHTGTTDPSGFSTGTQSVNDIAGASSAADNVEAHTHSFTTNATGGGLAHNNLQPYIVLNYIIKY